MKMKKLILIFANIIVILLMVNAKSQAVAMQGASAEEIFARAKKFGIISADSIVFGDITREQLVCLLASLFSGEDYPPLRLDNLKKSGFYKSLIYSAMEMGLINEYTSEHELRCFVKKQEALSLLAICTDFRTDNYDSLESLSDICQISNYAKPYVSALIDAKVLPVNNHSICPKVNENLIDYLGVIENILEKKYIAD